jgi:DNA helicase HerA-like ATPase
LVSFLEGNGVPAIVQRALILPPAARVGAITPAERQAIQQSSSLRGK